MISEGLPRLNRAAALLFISDMEIHSNSYIYTGFAQCGEAGV